MRTEKCKGVRQGYPLSPTLFTLYTADLERILQKGQAGGVVIGERKIWTLAYTNDIVLIVTNPEVLKETMGQMRKYLQMKELNAERSKVLIFRKDRRNQIPEKWNWGQETIEEVKEFKYLSFHFQKNGTYEAHIRETVKKARIAMAQVWGIEEWNSTGV